MSSYPLRSGSMPFTGSELDAPFVPAPPWTQLGLALVLLVCVVVTLAVYVAGL